MIRHHTRGKDVGGSGLSRRAVLGGVLSLGVALPALAGAARGIRPGEVGVVLMTSLGPIEVAVDLARAPITAGDFLKYVDRGLFNGGAFYRTVRPDNDINPVKIDVIQGGLTDEKKLLPPIKHEPTNRTGLRHRNGTISIARDKPGTGTAGEFFICIGDQPELDFGGKRNPDRQGFAAFGQVVRGMGVVRAIWKSKTGAAYEGLAMQRLVPPIGIVSAKRI
jgi:peptidyl-prolyl cis-trans isomerase A (cyclophilin A)